MISELGNKILVWSAIALVGCASGPQLMDRGDKNAAAEAEVKTKAEGNDNTQLDLSVRHLAKPENLNTGAGTYVVWAQNRSDPAAPVQKLGQLQVNDNLEGRFKTVTPFKNFDLFITAEPQAAVTYPSGYRALWTHVNE